MEREPQERGSTGAGRAIAAQLEFELQMRRFEEAQAELREIVVQIHAGHSQREVLHLSALTHLEARLDTMPVIEQAKGVLMAERRRGPDEAFDLPRRASQRANIKVSVLAAQIVENVASQPVSPGAVPAPLPSLAMNPDSPPARSLGLAD